MPVTKPPSRRSINFACKALKRKVNKHYIKHPFSYIFFFELPFLWGPSISSSQSSSPQLLPMFFLPFFVLYDVFPNPLFPF
jgi:hypothetical protein